jgi:hypothetical protein
VKSFYNHLVSRQEFGEKIEQTRKPILRSSGVFPVIKNKYYSTKILYLGYWLIKRNIPEVSLLITLRDQHGKILNRKLELINTVKAFSIDLDSILKEIHFDFNNDFLGSIETEFNTTRDMVYPYPALVLEYYNKDFNSCVHTIGRIYNDFEDLDENEKFKVPETGFDIYGNDDLSPFLAFVNGPIPNKDGFVEYVVTNFKSEKFYGSFKLGKIKPYETKFVIFKDHIPNLTKILGNKSGSISVKHNFEGFFPRFLVGNIQNSFPSVSFTHSYYDCTSCNTDSDFWNRINDDYYDSSVYIPLFLTDKFYTDLVIYPNFSPSDFILQINLYNKSGNKVYENTNFLNVKSNESKLLKIEFKKLCEELNLDKNEITSAHIIAKFEEKKIPSRLKFGLNVGISGLKSKLPCNICFNAKLGNPNIENKPGSFHWSPIFNDKTSIITIANFSTHKEYSKYAKVSLNFYHKQDSSFITREITLGPQAEFRISINDEELKQFFQDDGWITMRADNPFVQGYYFNFHSSGSVAGDHFF